MYRRNLDHLLIQAATYGGETYAPLAIVNQIADQRTAIQRLEATMSPSDFVTQMLARLVTPEQRNRARMLDKVRAFWIEGVLDHSTEGTSRIPLRLSYGSNAVDGGWRIRLHLPTSSMRPITTEMPIITMFDKYCGELLILGEPGGGKTTLLLELAQALLSRAEQVSTAAIPVVFNLSSWAEKRQPINEWLVDELNMRYDVPRKVGQAWVEADQILPLLDGLDEVKRDYRAACVTAINDFRLEHGMVQLAVCSRSAEYATLGTKLNLQETVTVLPLTAEQIDTYLLQLGPGMAPALSLLHADEGLRELVQTPLMLHVLALAYQDMPITILPTQASRTEWRQHLFASYVARMFQRGDVQMPYTESQTCRWLSYLARTMRDRAQTTLFLEHIQAQWLSQASHQQLYTFSIRLISGLFFGISSGIIGLSTVGPRVGLTMLLMGILIWSLCWGRWRPAWVGAIYGIGVGLAAWLTLGAVEPFAGGLFCIAMIAMTGMGCWIGARYAQPYRIQVVERLRWSWIKGLLPAVVVGPVIGLIAGGWAGWSVGLLAGARSGVSAGLALGLAAMLAAVLGTAITEGLTAGEVDIRTAPNQGIWRSAQMAARMGLVYCLVFGLSFALIGVMFHIWGSVLVAGPLQGLASWVGWGTAGSVGGFFMGTFAFGGLVCVQHLLLRALLVYSGSAPWNYPGFLDYAAERVFLRKVGGGYMFIHRLLLDYFADLPSEVANPAVNGEVTHESQR